MSHYRLSARYYDEIYEAKDYSGEVDRLLNWLSERNCRPNSVLDMACGTGRHLAALQNAGLACEGVDLEPGLLEVAALRLPGIPLHHADMRTCPLAPCHYPLITCWFGSVGYLGSVAGLSQAVAHWASLLKPGGWLALEPWLDPAAFQPGRMFTSRIEKDDHHVVRMAVSRSCGRLYNSEFHYLLATAEGVEHFVELHELFMFTREEYRQALEKAGLRPEFEPDRIAERGFYLAQKQ